MRSTRARAEKIPTFNFVETPTNRQKGRIQMTHKTPENPRSKGGRPTREEALAKQLAATGVDPASIDPRRILAGIAADESAPAHARVAAAKALMAATGDSGEDGAKSNNGISADEISRRALRLLNGGKADV
jgi:hypothetical protein